MRRPRLSAAALALLMAAFSLVILSAPASAMPACGVQEAGASPAAIDLVNKACTKIGVPYSWGGGHAASGPGETYGLCDPANGAPNDCHVKGFDCSGFARWAYWAATGSDMLNSTSKGQLSILTNRGFPNIAPANVKAGDYLFYGSSPSTVHHVAIALGGGYIVEALESGTTIHVSTSYANHRDLIAAKRPLP
ncbi:C40 family peptidase [Fodinicola acaciae]|uniref:C40 family peptidase n=1 Tax=Fodinicola acaciae TaxID=2681555 RepID=UPI0013D45C12|nr:NlpC/P60 family protein [Fodinicola acaciae]